MSQALNVPVPKYVYDFSEGSRDMRDLLGGKGANLAEMTNIGLPVPDGFTITTEACMAYLAAGASRPPGLDAEIAEHLTALERRTGKRLGSRRDPLLVSVRSGSKFSMPGMMDTILNLGLNDQSVLGLIEAGGAPRFAYDSYRRLVQMFGDVVAGVDGQLFEDALSRLKLARGVAADVELTADDLRELVSEFQAIYREGTGEDFPQEPQAQLDRAIDAVFRSWNTPRARTYRREYGISDDLGTAVNIVQMAFGNMGEDSATGVVFTRNPSTGANELYGEFLVNAQGEDVVAGIRTPQPLDELRSAMPKAFEQLVELLGRLEQHYREMQDVEFTIERGVLYVLQT
ncbi:MAG: PEP/pyruvate-binding domain-containing protein, partial [Gaiellales bacterium]